MDECCFSNLWFTPPAINPRLRINGSTTIKPHLTTNGDACEMAPVVERISNEVSALGEGPHWDADTQNLYYVDIFGKTIYRYTPATGALTKAIVAGTELVSHVIPVAGTKDKFIIGNGRALAVVTWDGVSNKVSNVEKIVEVENGMDGHRFNDGKCDPSGRLWSGTMGREDIVGHYTPDRGTLYSLEPNRRVVAHFGPVSISNGLAWSADNTKFYYIDSLARAVFQFDFDIKKGAISNKQVIFSLDTMGIEGYPDGQAIDTDGNLWVAVFNGYRVIKIDPRRKDTLLQTVKIPAKQVTSVAFGGPNLDELYVTSGSLEIDGVVLTPPEDHGVVHRVTGLGVKGLPGVRVKL